MSASGTPVDVAISPRDMHFNVEAAGKGHWFRGDPVGTAVLNALSLSFPDGERMFIDAIRHFRPQLNGKLAEDAQGFIAQEAIHSREHYLLNKVIDRNRYPVEEVLADIRETVGQARQRGPMATLLGTIALEHFTAIMAEIFLDPTVFEESGSEIEQLWRWHCMEEAEHKGVAFDVYMAATCDWSPFRRYRARVITMVLVTLNFTSHLTQRAARLLEGDGYAPDEAVKAVKRFMWRKPGLFARGWRTYLAWFRPGFHPWDRDNRAELDLWRRQFGSASSTPANAA